MPSSVHLYDESASSPVNLTNLFSKYFLSVFKRLFLTPISTNLDNLFPYNLPSNHLFSLEDILSTLVSLKKKLMILTESLLVYSTTTGIQLLLQSSFCSGAPQMKALSSICEKPILLLPIFKVSYYSDFSNYRPIFILPHLAKLFESLFNFCIKRNLNHIIINSQYSFRPHKSTITSNISFITYILNSFEANSQVDSILQNSKKRLTQQTMGFSLPHLTPLVSTIRSSPGSHPT